MDQITQQINPASMPDEYWSNVLSSADDQSERDLKAYEKYVQLFKNGTFGRSADESSRSTVSANQSFATINIMMSFLLAQQPSVEVESRDNNGSSDFEMMVQMGMFPTVDAAKTEFADSIEQLSDYSYETGGMQRQYNVALFEALTRGMGVSKVSFDPETGLERVDTFRRHEFYFDPHARTHISQCQYVIHHCEYPIAEAKRFFSGMGVDPNSIEANYQLGDSKSVQGEYAEQQKVCSHKDTYKFHEIWIKNGDERVIQYREYKTRKLIIERPWPFMLPNGDFPFSILAFHTQFSHLNDAFSHMHVVEGLREIYEDMVEFAGKHARRSIAKKIFYDKKLISPEDASKILDALDMRAIGVDKLAGKSINEIVQVLNFNDGNDASLQAASVAKSIIDEITGLDEFVRGAASTKRMSASEATIRDQNARLRVDRLQRLLDEFLTDQTRKRVLVAYQLVSPEVIARIAGPKAAMLWQVATMQPDSLLHSYSIQITAGSTGEMETQRRITRLKDFFQIAGQINATYQAPIYDLVGISQEMLRLNKVRRPERYMNVPVYQRVQQSIVAPPPPPMPPGQPQLPELTEEQVEGNSPPPAEEQQEGEAI